MTDPSLSRGHYRHSLDAEFRLIDSAFCELSLPPVFALFAAGRLLERWIKTAVGEALARVAARSDLVRERGDRLPATPKLDVDAAVRVAYDVGVLDEQQAHWCHTIRLMGNAARHDHELPAADDRVLCFFALTRLAPCLGWSPAQLPSAGPIQSSRFHFEIEASLGGVEAIDRLGAQLVTDSDAGIRRPDVWRLWLIRRAIETRAWGTADRLLEYYFSEAGALAPRRRLLGAVGEPVRLRSLRLSRDGREDEAIQLLEQEATIAGYLMTGTLEPNPEVATSSTFDYGEALGILAGALRRKAERPLNAQVQTEIMQRSIALYETVFSRQPWNIYAGINVAHCAIQIGERQKAARVADLTMGSLTALVGSDATNLPLWLSFSKVSALGCTGRLSEAQALFDRTLAKHSSVRPGDCAVAQDRWHRVRQLLECRT